MQTTVIIICAGDAFAHNLNLATAAGCNVVMYQIF